MRKSVAIEIPYYEWEYIREIVGNNKKTIKAFVVRAIRKEIKENYE